jgi:hypothetical protein
MARELLHSLMLCWPNRRDAVLSAKERIMARGSKAKYTDKQKRRAEHIEKGYEKQGVSKKESERRAWATVNKMSGGGEKPGGSGSGK